MKRTISAILMCVVATATSCSEHTSQQQMYEDSLEHPPSREQFRQWAQESRGDPDAPSQKQFKEWKRQAYGDQR